MRGERKVGEQDEVRVDVELAELVEDRVAEIAALLEVVQDEAEETFLSTASLLRGLRRGGKQVSRVKRKIGDIRRG